MISKKDVEDYVHRLLIDLEIQARQSESSQELRLSIKVNALKEGKAEGLRKAAEMIANDFDIFFNNAEIKRDRYQHIPRSTLLPKTKEVKL